MIEQTKTCCTCSNQLKLEDFPVESRKADGRASKCKRCYSAYKKEWNRTPKGWVNAVYTNQVNNSRRRGHPRPAYTKEALLSWALTHGLAAYLQQWAASNFDPLLRPSVDRLREHEGYSLSNIRLVTWKENHERNSREVIQGKATPRTRRCRQLTLDGRVVAEYCSISEAARQNGLRRGAISNVCIGRKRKTGGFRWEHVN